MTNKSATLATLLAAYLLYAVGAVGPRQTPQPTSSAGGARAKSDTARHPNTFGLTGTDLLEAYLGQPLASVRSAVDVDFLFVMMPDPVDTHLDDAFDSELESVRRAFETERYAPDRFWLPWSHDRVMASTTSNPDTLALRWRHPGVMLFRDVEGRDSSTKLRVVYLIGERPTGGLHKGALLAALRERTAIVDSLAYDALAKVPRLRMDAIRIVGPAFSGGTPSLRIALARWRAEDPSGGPIEIISGSASDSLNLVQLTDTALQVTFKATVHPDQTLTIDMLHFMCEGLDIDPEQIVLLREATTSYGRDVIDSSAQPPQHSARCSAPAHRPIAIPFPLSIASLRNEYARQAQSGSLAAPVPGAVQPRIPLDLEEPSWTADNPPVMSALTAPALDLILDEIGKTILAHKARAVGILATDTRDKLFLASEVRRRVPDVLLFTYESDVLYLRPEYNEYMRGALVFSTYPLFLETQRWDPGLDGHRLLPFASEASEGVFNATLLQLRDSTHLFDYSDPYEHKVTRRPPVYLSVIGRNSFAPVAIASNGQYAPSDFADTYMARHDTVHPVSTPPTRDVSMSLLLVLVFLLALASWFAYDSITSRENLRERHATMLGDPVWTLRQTWSAIRERTPRLRSSKARPSPTSVASSLHVHQGGLLIVRETFVALRILALSGAVIPLTLVLVQVIAHEQRVPWLMVVLVISTLFLAALALLWASGRELQDYIRRAAPHGVTFHDVLTMKKTSREARLWYLEVISRTLLVIGGVAYAALVVVFATQVTLLEGVRKRLFVERLVQLGSGVSPAVPLLVGSAIFVLWVSTHLRRIPLLLEPRGAFEDACAPWQYFPFGDCPLLPTFVRQAQPLVRRIRRTLVMILPDYWVLAVSVLIGAALLVVWAQSGRTIEAIALPPVLGVSLFDVLYHVSIVGTLGLLVWALCRFVAVWWALQHLLDCVAQSPLITAFERLPRRIARLTRLSAVGFQYDRIIASISHTQWAHVRRLFEFEASGSLSQDAEKVMRDPTPTPTRGTPDPQRTIGETTRTLYQMLSVAWSLEPTQQDAAAVLEELKSERPLTDATPRSTSGFLRRSTSNPPRLWLRALEEFAAVQFVDYVEWVFQHLRDLAVFIVGALVLMIALLASYPLLPGSIVRLGFLLILALAVISLVTIMFQMNRDEVLSRIAGTDPGRVNWDASFVVHIAIVVAIPVLAVVTSQFPAARDSIFSWLDPVVRAVSQH